ncbi:MAG: hypothetical protein ACFKPT_22300 [Gloeotrichia echinulata GP01]
MAVKIPIAEFEKIAAILEEHGVAKLMEAVGNEEPISREEALQYYQLLINENLES